MELWNRLKVTGQKIINVVVVMQVIISEIQIRHVNRVQRINIVPQGQPLAPLAQTTNIQVLPAPHVPIIHARVIMEHLHQERIAHVLVV